MKFSLFDVRAFLHFQTVYYHDFNKENKETATHQSHRLLTNCKISYFPFFVTRWTKLPPKTGNFITKTKINLFWFRSMGKEGARDASSKAFWFILHFLGKYSKRTLGNSRSEFCRFRNWFCSKCNDYVDGMFVGIRWHFNGLCQILKMKCFQKWFLVQIEKEPFLMSLLCCVPLLHIRWRLELFTWPLDSGHFFKSAILIRMQIKIL